MVDEEYLRPLYNQPVKFQKVEEELIKLEKTNNDLTDCLEKEREFRRKAESEIETWKTNCNDLTEKKSALDAQINRW